MITKRELRALADAATPGEWFRNPIRSKHHIVQHDPSERWPNGGTITQNFDDKEAFVLEQDTDFICAANPKRVKELLDEIEAYRKQFTRIAVTARGHIVTTEEECDICPLSIGGYGELIPNQRHDDMSKINKTVVAAEEYLYDLRRFSGKNLQSFHSYVCFDSGVKEAFIAGAKFASANLDALNLELTEARRERDELSKLVMFEIGMKNERDHWKERALRAEIAPDGTLDEQDDKEQETFDVRIALK